MNTALFPRVGSPRREGLLSRIARMLAIRRQRRVLAELSPERLRDIGLTAGQAQAEAGRSVWDAPVYWLR